MKKLVTLFLIFLVSFGMASSQCPNSQFSAAGPVCADIPINFSNTSSGAISYQWDFCAGDFDSLITDTNDVSGFLNTPSGITAVSDSSGNFVFACSRGDDKIIRYDYANGFNNLPTLVTDLGNVFGQVSSPNGIVFHRENSVWYALVLSVFNNTMTRIEFGNGLNNNPTAASVIVSSNLNLPRGLDIITDHTGKVIVAIANFIGSSVTVVDFGNSITNAPVVGSPYSLTGGGAIDVDLVMECGTYYALVSCYNSNEIVLVNYGSSMLNAPSANAGLIGGLGNPSGVSVVQDNANWYVLASNSLNGKVTVHNIGNSFSAPSPVLEGEIELGAGNPAGINLIKHESDWFAFVTMEASNIFKKVNFRNTCNVSQAVSGDSNPVNVSYGTGGNYRISLEAMDASGNSHFSSQTVSVFISPVADFSMTGNCLGDQSQFSDSSYLASGSFSSWSWHFGNGDSSSVQHPFYTYSDTGSYPVRLITTASNGCSDTITKIFEVSLVPVAAFSTTPGCSESSLTFTDLSTIGSGSITDWLWEFGTGDTSTLSNPVYAYASGGTYPIILSVTSDKGCTDSISQNLIINDRPLGSYLASNTCVGQVVQFTDQTSVSGTSIVSYSWEFGDGDTSTLQNPGHLYAGGVANYDVRLIVTAANGCVDTVDRNIKINNVPVASFSYSPLTVCQGNDVQFTDLSLVSSDTISSWFWDFGDGSTDTVRNPVHQFANSGNQTISLIAYSPSSCPSPVSQQTITITASPSALFNFTEACLGDPTLFSDMSTAPTGSTIISRVWNFGTGDSSLLTNPAYTFAGSGLFPVVLSVTTDAGCVNSYNTTVPVHALPVAAFSTSNLCSNQAAVFNNLSSADTNSVLVAYEWNFGDFGSGAANTSSLANPVHTYINAGLYDVFLIASTDHSCKDTALVQIRINPSAPANFTYSPTCYGDLMEFFNPGSSLDSAYFWSFGDSQSNQLKEPAHFYAFPGNYTVTLTVYAQGGCATSASRLVSVSPIPEADFTVSPACIGTPYQFTDNSSISSGSIVNWQWTIDNLAVIDSVRNPVYTFNDTGSYTVTLLVSSDIGCTHNVSGVITSNPLPVANFSFNPQFGNPPLDVQFSDFSTGAVGYSWDFGDGQSGGNLANPSHIYQDTGLFTIRQTVFSNAGCTDSVSKNIYVIRPILDIAITGDSSYISGNYFHLVVRIANLGTRQIDSVNIEGRLADGTNVLEKYVSLIPNGPSGIQWYTFHAKFLITASTKLDYYCVKVSEPNGESDDFPSNNEKCFSRIKTLAIVGPYPNPFTETVTVKAILPFDDELEIDLIDHTGKTVKTITSGFASEGLNEYSINLSGLADGLYTLRFQFRDEVSTRPILKNSVNGK